MNVAEARPPLARPATLALGIGALFVVLWPLALFELRRGDVYAVMGPFAVLVVASLTVLRRAARAETSLRRPARNALVGAAAGVVMTLGTYVAYALALRVVPSLAPHVAGLYRASRAEELVAATAWTAVIVVAEEVLWRGWLLEVMTSRAGKATAIALSLATYVAAQAGSGSGAVVLAAAVCGACWLALRVASRSLVAPLVAHMIWTLTVVHLVPLTRVV